MFYTVSMQTLRALLQKPLTHQLGFNTKPKADTEWKAVQPQTESDNNRHISYLLIDTARWSVSRLMNY